MNSRVDKFVLIHTTTSNNDSDEIACIEFINNTLQINRTFQSILQINSNDDTSRNKAQTLNSILENSVWILFDQQSRLPIIRRWFEEYNYSMPTPISILDVAIHFNNKSLTTIFEEFNLLEEKNFDLFKRNKALSECHMIYECLLRQSFYRLLSINIQTQLSQQQTPYNNTINTNNDDSNNINNLNNDNTNNNNDDFKSVEPQFNDTNNNNNNGSDNNNINTNNNNDMNNQNLDDNHNDNNNAHYLNQNIDNEPELEPRNTVVNNDNTINNNNNNIVNNDNSNRNFVNHHSKSTNTYNNSYSNNSNNRPTKPPQPQQNSLSYKTNIVINQDLNNELNERNISMENEEDDNESNNEQEDNENENINVVGNVNNINNNDTDSNNQIQLMDRYNEVNSQNNFNNNDLRYQNGGDINIDSDINNNNELINNSKPQNINSIMTTQSIQSTKPPSSWAKRLNTEKAPGSPQKKRLTIKNVSQDTRHTMPRKPDPRFLPRTNSRSFKTKETKDIKRYIHDAMKGYQPVWISYKRGKYPLVPRGIHPTRWDNPIQGSRLAFFAIPYKSQSGKEAKFFIDLVVEARSKNWNGGNQQQNYRNPRGDNRRNVRRNNYNDNNVSNSNQLASSRYSNNGRNNYPSNSRRQQNIRS